ncbi:aminoglycoside phosphotransferase family protein [Roseibium litorale]|uniref:Aminoglycoside phosphotransferase family protein n=1 Tax=Roseibium litorale TaxID=2803841 RepID=A0ABR9CQX5_9HYPH|nr:aminoglycoside phosphotransferase family protein [Roseibium litorale]MBD8893227.1 aminoglycoside phosphotransferase family protein [Roseibium litorale]
MSEHGVTLDSAKALLARFAASWASLPIREVISSGTDNALFLLGDESVLRIPKRESAAILLEKELAWLPRLQALPLAVPKVLFHGKAKQETGFDFGIFKWEPGGIATPDQIADTDQAAEGLGRFLTGLHKVDTDGAPVAGQANHMRGVSLPALTKNVIAGIEVLADEINAPEARRIWEEACAAAPAQRAVWLHGDLKADNMLASGGALTAIIDWGLAAVGDPAVDYAAAWSWVAPQSRGIFRVSCGLSEDDWSRARGWALHNAVIALSYYRGRSHEALCEQSRLTLRRLGLSPV